MIKYTQDDDVMMMRKRSSHLFFQSSQRGTHKRSITPFLSILPERDTHATCQPWASWAVCTTADRLCLLEVIWHYANLPQQLSHRNIRSSGATPGAGNTAKPRYCNESIILDDCHSRWDIKSKLAPFDKLWDQSRKARAAGRARPSPSIAGSIKFL